jgi:hypothetical protein
MDRFLMKTPDKSLYDHVRGILKRSPLNRIRLDTLQTRELSDLIKMNRIVVLHPYFGMGKDVALTRGIVHEVVLEFLDLYGSAHYRRRTAAAKNFPAGAILLWVPLALLEIPSIHEEYTKRVRHETRRYIRLAERQGYEFKEFVWNDHLDDIFEINTSKEVRQSEPMHGWYTRPVQPRHYTKEELQFKKYYGAFKDGKLYAYVYLYECGDFAFIKHFLGHARHLRYGIMNGLISWTVKECIKNSQIRWMFYGPMEKSLLGSFKKGAGFQEYATLLDLGGDQGLLKYSEKKVRTLWRL